MCVSKSRAQALARKRLLASLALVLVMATEPLFAQTLTTLHSFTGYPNDGADPISSMVVDAQGNLYGTTEFGGSVSCADSIRFGCGTVFKLTPSGTESTLHNFAGSPDGDYVKAGLIADAQGNLYGTTTAGGRTFAGSTFGTVFRVTPSGEETPLYSFRPSFNTLPTSGARMDGANPYTSLTMDSSGNLYGTTSIGGAYGFGAVFKVDPSGKETVLYSFGGYPGDGLSPFSGLERDAQGTLYGTTYAGGSHGVGTVFKLTAGGQESVLYSFQANGDGTGPIGNLAMDGQGNLYGTTFFTNYYTIGYGVVFKVTPTGTQTVLHTFSDRSDGGYPLSGVIIDADGNLYGTASRGGNAACADGCGVVFTITSQGSYKVLYAFSGTDGESPQGGLVMDGQGSLYGTTAFAGDDSCSTGQVPGCGTVFKLTP